jgi:glycosyltransferase involved in cell wall biosynthesis
MRYKEERRSDLKLILLGKSAMKIPEDEDIIPLGFVSEEDKFNGIAASDFMIMPSKYESFSMVIMESWACKKAVLVNGRCDVLKGHCLRSNGGLWYESYEEFKECLDLLISDDRLRAKMGENGKQYVEENYSWPKIEEKYLRLLDTLNSHRD